MAGHFQRPATPKVRGLRHRELPRGGIAHQGHQRGAKEHLAWRVVGLDRRAGWDTKLGRPKPEVFLPEFPKWGGGGWGWRWLGGLRKPHGFDFIKGQFQWRLEARGFVLVALPPTEMMCLGLHGQAFRAFGPNAWVGMSFERSRLRFD